MIRQDAHRRQIMAGTKKSATLKRPRKTPFDVLKRFNVAVPNRVEVKRYLSQHPQLAAPLVKICDAARGEFGPDAELALEVYKDPEMPDQYLTLYVRQDGYAA